MAKRKGTPSAKKSPKAVSTPPRTSTSGGAPVTPGSCRKSRMDELTDVQDLNQRLEVYILGQREREENENGLRREMDLLKEFYEDELEKMKASHDEAVSYVRQSRDKYAEESKTMEGQNARQEGTIKLLKAQTVKQKKLLQTVEAKASRMSEENNAIKEESKQVAHDLDQTVEELQRTQALLEPLKTLESQYRTLKEDHHLASQKLEQEKNDRRREKEQHTVSLEAKVRDIRQEFGKRLKQLLQERKDNLYAKMNELRETTENEYLAQLKAKNAELSNVQEQLRAEMQKNADAQAELSALQNDQDLLEADQAAARLTSLQSQLASKEKDRRTAERELKQASLERDVLKKQLEEMESKLNEQHDFEAQLESLEADLGFQKDHNKKLQDQLKKQKQISKQLADKESKLEAAEAQIVQLEEQLATASEEMQSKEEEYDSLLGLKVALDMEIKQFRFLIKSEEERLVNPSEVVPSSKKRKRAPSGKEEVEEAVAETPPPAKGRAKKSSRKSSAKKSSAKKSKSSSSSSSMSQLMFRAECAMSSLNADILIRNIEMKNQQPRKIEVANESDKEIALDGWTVNFSASSSASMRTYSFPDLSPLRPGEAVVIWLTKANKINDRNVRWAGFDDEEFNGGRFDLLNPYGARKSDVDCSL